MTSLPSRFGIGDLGPEAYRFADSLHRAGQRIWQILPLAPTDTLMGNSPYSSSSAFAGNPLLISPERLVEEGFLKRSDLTGAPRFPQGRVDYRLVAACKEKILSEAWQRFSACGGSIRDDYDPSAGMRALARGILPLSCPQSALWGEDLDPMASGVPRPADQGPRAARRGSRSPDGRAEVPAVSFLPPVAGPQGLLQRPRGFGHGRSALLRPPRQRRCVGKPISVQTR